MTQEEYFNYTVDERGRPVLSSSFLKNGMPMNSGNPARLEAIYNENIQKEQTLAMGFGTLVHQYAEDRTRFVMVPEFDMSPTIRMIADKTFKLVEESRTDIWDNAEHHSVEFEAVCLEQGWGQSWKPETRMKKFRESADDYWDLMKSSQGKIVVTGDTVTQLNNVIKGLENAGLEYPVLKDRNEHIKREEAILFEINGKYPAKALVDILEIDHENKKVYITDLKTTSGTIENFISGYSYQYGESGLVERVSRQGDFIKYKYFFQGMFYTKAVTSYLRKYGLDDYEITFQFAVVETKAPYLAKMITYPYQWIEASNYEFNQAMLNVEDWYDKLKYLEF